MSFVNNVDDLDYCNEYGLVSQLVYISVEIAKCSEPVSKMTFTGLAGVPMNKVPTYRASGVDSRGILI